jgi:RNA polymerase sigma factor (TIGR02999 family)
MDDQDTPGSTDAAALGHQVTLALQAARGGDPAALNEAFHLVYDEVRAIAHARVARAGGGGTLDTTAVVHEAYLKLARHGGLSFADRQHFLAVASTAMRQVLLDHARRRLSARRGGGAEHLPLTKADPAADEQAREVVALDEALRTLAALDPQLARVVELRWFGGLTIEETAGALEVSEATVMRAWRRARAWLQRELDAGAGEQA